MTHDELALKIYNVSHLTGEFKLRSGQISNEYFDKYQFESRPEILKEIAKQLAPLIPSDTEVLAGLEMGGLPIATALSLETGLPVCFVRKTAKEYGTCLFAEGADIKNKKVCVIEDVITSGGQVIISTQDLRSMQAQIHTVICVINRGGDEALQKLKAIHLDVKSLFVRSDFPTN
ncbi:MAG: orotate phosphoribosyltransferase [Pseudobdellovibrio sp.]